MQTRVLAHVVHQVRAMVALHARPLHTEASEPDAPAIALLDIGSVDAGLASALADVAVHRVADLAALEQLTTTTTLDALVASWRDGLADIASRLRLRLIVVSPTLPDALVEAVGRGVDACWVDAAAGLATELGRVRRSVRPANGTRHRFADLRVRWPGGAGEALVRDLSNDGIAFEVGDGDVETILPGSVIDNLSLARGGRLVAGGVRAIVRHITPIGEPGRYRVGCALKPTSAAPAAARTVRDRALAAALMKAGVRSGLVIAPLDGDARDGADELQLVAGRVDAASGTLTAACEASLKQHDLVRGHFEVAGRLYRFVTVVLAEAPLTLKLPAVLEESQQRAQARYRAMPNEAHVVELRSLLGDGSAVKTLADVSASGFSFAIDGARDLYPLGLQLDVTLRLPDGPLHLSGEVRTLVREGARLRCGVALRHLDEAAHLRLANWVMRLRFPGVDDGGGAECDELFDFFRTTGFLYPAKEEVLAPMLSEVRSAFGALYSQPSRLFKAVVARDDAGQLVGHVSGVRAYRHTWMSHHLAAQPSKHVAHLLNLGAAEYFGQNPDLEYFKIYFHADNKWPARVFGGFARMLRNSSQSELRAFRHLTLSTDAPLLPRPEGIDVMEASDLELAIVERYFVARERGLLLRADDLTRQSLTLSELNKSFTALGLFRRRRVLVAMRRNVCLGFALAELSSPGLNLSEGLSMFRTFVTPEGEPLSPTVRLALLHAVRPIYRAAGRAFLRGLMTPEEVTDWARIGVPAEETSYAWTCHRALYPRFCDHVDRLFEILRKRRRA